MRVAPVQFASGTMMITAVSFPSARFALERFSQSDYTSAFAYLTIGLLGLAFSAANGIAAKDVLNDYKGVKHSLSKHGWDDRIVATKRYSFCQRNAARRAAIDLGYGKEAKEYFRAIGYRWYHVFPDSM